jgi:Dolichyl-phosphate-mannose-protein mannosyltransferase
MVSQGDHSVKSAGSPTPALPGLAGTEIAVQPTGSSTVAEGQHGQGRPVVPGRTDDGPLPKVFWVVVGMITVGGLLLRLPSFNDSLFGDEISTYYLVVGNNLGRVLALLHSDQETTPPLYFVLAWATKGILSSPAQSIRLISLVTGTAAIPLTFLLGLRTVGRRAALVGAACVALSPYMIFYSTEARTYMLVLFLALLSTLALLRSLDTGRLGWWVAYAACSCAAVYSHYSVVFLLVVQLGWALWTQPQARRALVLANVAAGIAYLPWLGVLRQDLNAPNLIGVLSYPLDPQSIGRILEGFWIGHPLVQVNLLPGELAVALATAGLAIGVLGVALRVKRNNRWQWRLPPRTVLIVLVAFAPAALVALYSWTRVDIMAGQFYIASWPGLSLAIGTLVASPPKPLRVAAVALTLAAYGVGAAMMLGSTAQRPNIDAAAAYIDRIGSNGDPIVSQPFSANPLTELDVALADAGHSQYHPVLRLGVPPLAEQLPHLAGPHPQPVFFGLPVTPPQDVATQAVDLARHGTIFLVSSANAFLFANSKSSISHSNVQLNEFLEALPSRFHVVQHMTFPSYPGAVPQSLYVIRDVGPNH